MEPSSLAQDNVLCHGARWLRPKHILPMSRGSSLREQPRSPKMTEVHSLPQPRQLLQAVPVGQAVLGGFLEELVGLALLVEMAGKTSLGPREAGKVHRLILMRVNVPILLHAGIAGQTETFADAVAHARIVK